MGALAFLAVVLTFVLCPVPYAAWRTLTERGS